MPSGNLGYNPLRGTRDLTTASLNAQNSQEGIQLLNDSLNTFSRAQQNQQTRLLAEDKNLKLNSLKGLYMQAYDNPDFAAKSAASMFNRIESAQDKDSINKIYQELEGIHEKAQDNKYLFDLAEVGDSFLNAFGRLNPLGMDRPESLKKSKEKLLRENNSDLGEISKWLTPTDLLTNVKGHVNEVDYKAFGKNLLTSFKSPDELNAKLKKALSSPTPQNALDDIIGLRLQDNFVTRGNDLYREGPEARQFQADALSSFKNPDDITKKYYKYDLENETLGSLKASIAGELTGLLGQPDSKENAQKIASYRQSLELIDKRQKDNSKIYGVNKYEDPSSRLFSTGRGGALNAMTAGVVDLSNVLFRGDFEGAIYKKALYQPQIASYDSKGRPVMSNQFMYEKEDGSTGFNFAAIPEAGLHMTAQMLPTLATGSLVGGIVGGVAGASSLGTVSRAAASLERGYERLNKVGVLPKSTPLIGGELNIADRLATFLTVTANTMPSMIAEEKKWGGNYFKRGSGKAIVEGLTEGIGFPDIGALKFKRFEADLTTSAKRAAGVEMKFSDNLRNYMSSTKQFVVMGAKQNAVEALEEELSLLGNALLEGSVMPEEFVGRDKTEVTGEAMLDTFVESFAAGSIYSGITTGFQGFASGNKTHVQNQADWEAANNPELFKAKLKELNNKGSLSDEQYSQSVLEVNRKAAILKGLFGYENIRDSKTLLEDKDEQYKYYINHLRQDELVNIDYDQLTEQERQVFASRKIADKIDTKGRDRMSSIRRELGNLSREEQTPETLSKVEGLIKEYQTIRRANIKTLNKKELTQDEERVLKEKGILGEKDFEYTKADLDAELEKVTTDILKTQKRIEKYVNLSEDEKAKVISDAYDEKILDLDKIEDPNELIQSRLNLEQDINYLKLKGNYKDKAQIANRERLLDAYGERFDQLVNQRDDNGRNYIEQQIENFDYEGVEASLNLYQITKMRNQIEENRDFINEDMAKTADENLQKSQIKVLESLLAATPEQRLSALGTFLDNVAPINASYAYNVDSVNKLFPGIEYTKEELDAAREAFIQRRAQVRSMQMSDQPTPDTDLTDEEAKDVEEFNESLPTEEDAAQPVDESGKSPVTDKYSKRYKEILGNFKQKYPTESNQRFLEFLINTTKVKLGQNSKENAQVSNLLRQFTQKQITEPQFVQEINTLIEALKKDIELRKKNNTKFDAVQDKVSSLDLLKYMATRFVREELVEGPIATATTTAATPSPVPSNVPTPTPTTPTNPDASTEFPQVIAKNKTLDSQLEIRLARLRFLASPIRSVGVEFSRSDQRRTDPADIRNARAIEEIADQPYQVRIQSRKGTAMMFLAMKFPDKTEEQLIDDFATIEAMFDNTILTAEQWNAKSVEEQDAILEPMHSLLGKEYFDRAALAYFVANNGKGFTKESTVSITSSDADGNLNLFEGYPLQLNFPAEGRVSERIEEEYKEAGVGTEALKQEHANNSNTLARLKAYLSQNTDAFIDTDYTVSEGVVFKSAEQKKANELNDETINSAGIQDFDLATEVGQSIFGKRFNFKLGRVYFNNNGTPVILSNTNIDESEAEAIAEMLFSETLPAEFRTVEGLENYLVSLINQVDKKNRIHFFPNKNFPSKTEAVQYPFNIIRTVYKDGKPVNTKLTKEDFVKFLKESFYKLDKKMLQGGETMMRVSLVDGKPKITKQSYVEYIKDTHTFPVTSSGELLSPVNKVVYPDPKNFVERASDLLPKVQPTLEPITPKPVVAPQAPQVQPTPGKTIDEFIAITYMDAVNYAKGSPTAQAYGIYNAFVNFLTKEIYEQAIQTMSDNPASVDYQIVTRKLETVGKTTNLIPGIVPYNSEVEGDFILATVQLEGGKKVPVILMRKEQGIGGIKFRYNPLRVFRGNSPENFESMSKEEYLNPALKQPVAATPTQPADTKADVKLSPTDKIIWGHPTIGKSYLKKNQDNRFISLDDDYAAEINTKVKEIADKYNVTTYQVKDGGNQQWNAEYNQMMQNLFDKAKAIALSENKILFTSNTTLLKNNAAAFDKVINLTDTEFQKRISERGAKYDTVEWKKQIEDVISNIPSDKVILTDKYLSNLLPTQPSTPVSTDTKAEIEKKRQEEIDNLFGNYGVDEYKVKQKEINAKYDAQLAALGQPVAPKQSLADRLNSQSTGELFDEEEVQEAQKAKEDCINPAKQVKDQIKKKPKL